MHAYTTLHYRPDIRTFGHFPGPGRRCARARRSIDGTRRRGNDEGTRTMRSRRGRERAWMRSVVSSVTCALVVVVLAATTVEGRIARYEVNKDDRSLIPMREPFGFERGGTMEIALREPRVYLPEHAPPLDKTRLGFVITEARDEGALDAALEDKRVHSWTSISSIRRLRSRIWTRRRRRVRWRCILSSLRARSPCRGITCCFSPVARAAVVSFEITATLNMNKDAKGRADYLGSGEKSLPSVYYMFFLLDTAACAAWAFALGRRQSGVRKIHWLMLALVCSKTLSVLAQAGRYHITRLTGSSRGWTAAYYIFTICRSMLLFSVIALVGMGWSFLKPFLHQREKNLLMAVIPLQVMANIATIVIGQEGPADQGWFAWQNMFIVIDIICCCAVLVPVVWSIKHLRDSAAGA